MLARIRKASEEREGGFTLIELLVVIIIIGILAAIAIPVFLNQRQKGYDAQAKSDARNIATLEETYMTDNPTGYTDDANGATLGANGFKKSSTVTINTKANAANGYCEVAKSTAGNYWVYDSMAGGLQATSTTVFPTTWPAGGSCTTAAPASF